MNPNAPQQLNNASRMGRPLNQQAQLSPAQLQMFQQLQAGAAAAQNAGKVSQQERAQINTVMRSALSHLQIPIARIDQLENTIYANAADKAQYVQQIQDLLQRFRAQASSSSKTAGSAGGGTNLPFQLAGVSGIQSRGPIQVMQGNPAARLAVPGGAAPGAISLAGVQAQTRPPQMQMQVRPAGGTSLASATASGQNAHVSDAFELIPVAPHVIMNFGSVTAIHVPTSPSESKLTATQIQNLITSVNRPTNANLQVRPSTNTTMNVVQQPIPIARPTNAASQAAQAANLQLQLQALINNGNLNVAADGGQGQIVAAFQNQMQQQHQQRTQLAQALAAAATAAGRPPMHVPRPPTAPAVSTTLTGPQTQQHLPASTLRIQPLSDSDKAQVWQEIQAVVREKLVENAKKILQAVKRAPPGTLRAEVVDYAVKKLPSMLSALDQQSLIFQQ
ncbi:hypothetical protein HDU93_002939, partial [Gonapodya sp. JEL0774]